MIFNELAHGISVAGNAIAAYKTLMKSSKYIYLIAGTHGDEVEGVYVLKKLFDWLKENDTLIELPIVVVPVLNVDGHHALTRVNANQVDLNRNYPTHDWTAAFKQKKYNPGPEALSEPENKFLISLFDQYHPAIILSFHSWKPILNYNGDSKDIAEYLASHNDYPIDGDIGYPTPGSLGTFGPEKYQAGVLTFECPPLSEREDSLEKIWLENEKGLKGLFIENILKSKI
jgi:murein peptide amidase A